MSRPRINTHPLDLSERRMLLELFGTPKHAYETLRLAERGVTFVAFQRMWAGMEAPEKEVKTTEEHFIMWRTDFLKQMRYPTFKLNLEKWEDGKVRA